MKYSEMNNSEKFLASFNNDSNGYAKVIEIKGNVILGYIGRFGYSVFEMQKDGYFSNVTDFTRIEDATKEFNERIDQTGMLSLTVKIEMVENFEAKQFLKERVIALNSEQKSLEKCKAIHTKCILDSLANKTVLQIQNIALDNLQRIYSSIVLNNRFLNVI